MNIERIIRDGVTYAEIIWGDSKVEKSTFISPVESSMQFGIIAHEAGYLEEAHSHPRIKREVHDLQQMLVVQEGIIEFIFYTDEGEVFKTVDLTVGDSILLVHGVHAIRAKTKIKCVSVKHGPFLGAEHDKKVVAVKHPKK